MKDILQRVMALDVLAENVFFDGVLDPGKPERAKNFALILQSVAQEAKEAFYQHIPEDEREEGRQYFEAAIARLGSADEAQLRATEQDIVQLLDLLPEKIVQKQKQSDIFLEQVQSYRTVIKSGFMYSEIISDQLRGVEAPPLQKAYDPQAELVELPRPDNTVLKTPNILDCINARKSRRKYTGESLTFKELAYLLWATQGIKKITPGGKNSYRTVPSGGARHPFETYLAVNQVEHLKQGVYRYLPVEHKLVYLFGVENMAAQLTEANFGQPYFEKAAVTFIWSVIPYRCEWRYTIEAKKIILQDSGHLCQNLYLACESINCGTVAIGAYHQELMDAFLQLDGHDEFVVYLAPVGRVKDKQK